MKTVPVSMEALLKGLKDNQFIELDLSDQDITDEAIESFAAALATNTSLITLVLQTRKITDHGANYLRLALEQNTFLTNLHLEGNSLDPIKSVIRIIKGWRSSENECSHLDKELVLTIKAYILRNRLLKLLHKQQAVGHPIRQLDLSQAGIDRVGEMALAYVLEKDSTLTELNLGKTLIRSQTAKAFVVALQNNKTLTVLKMEILDENDLEEIQLLACIERNVMLSRMPQLVAEASKGEINLKGLDFAIGNQGALILGEAFKSNPAFSQVRYLDVSYNQIDSGIIALIQGLESHAAITKLILTGNRLTDNGVQAVAQWIPKSKTVTCLRLAQCEIKSEGMLVIAQALTQNKMIKEVDLRLNAMELEDLQVFAELVLKNPTLIRLELPHHQRLINKLLAIDRSPSVLSFCQAAKQGDFELVQALYLAGADLEQQDRQGNTPLCLAASYGHEEVVSFLIPQGANLHHQNAEGDTTIALALKCGQTAIITALEQAAILPRWLSSCLEDLKNPAITSLDLSSGYFTLQNMNNQHMRVLADALKNNCTITSLNLAYNELDETAAQFILDVLLIHTSLVAVDLTGNQCRQRPIRLATVEIISQALERNKLRNIPSSAPTPGLSTSEKFGSKMREEAESADAIQLSIMQNRFSDLEEAGKKRVLSSQERQELNDLRKNIEKIVGKTEKWTSLPPIPSSLTASSARPMSEINSTTGDAHQIYKQAIASCEKENEQSLNVSRLAEGTPGLEKNTTIQSNDEKGVGGPATVSQSFSVSGSIAFPDTSSSNTTSSLTTAWPKAPAVTSSLMPLPHPIFKKIDINNNNNTQNFSQEAAREANGQTSVTSSLSESKKETQIAPKFFP